MVRSISNANSALAEIVSSPTRSSSRDKTRTPLASQAFLLIWSVPVEGVASTLSLGNLSKTLSSTTNFCNGAQTHGSALHGNTCSRAMMAANRVPSRLFSFCTAGSKSNGAENSTLESGIDPCPHLSSDAHHLGELLGRRREAVIPSRVLCLFQSNVLFDVFRSPRNRRQADGNAVSVVGIAVEVVEPTWHR